MNQRSSTAIVEKKGGFDCRALSGMVCSERDEGDGGWIVMQNGVLFKKLDEY